MSKRVANKKGKGSRNRGPQNRKTNLERKSLQKEIRASLRDIQQKAQAEVAARPSKIKVEKRPFLSRVFDAFKSGGQRGR